MASIFIISGPSGAGEDSVIEALERDFDFKRVRTTVTRPMRPGETEGRPYYFVSREQFEAMIERDELVEWAVVYGDYRGATREEVDRCMGSEKPFIWKVDWQGVQTIKARYPEAVSVLILPPSYEVLETRLRRRGTESPEEIKRREDFTKQWLARTEVYDHVVVNEEGALDHTVAEVKRIIEASNRRHL
jgi:guanylate kinase